MGQNRMWEMCGIFHQVEQVEHNIENKDIDIDGVTDYACPLQQNLQFV